MLPCYTPIIMSGQSKLSILMYHLPDEETERMVEVRDIIDTVYSHPSILYTKKQTKLARNFQEVHSTKTRQSLLLDHLPGGDVQLCPVTYPFSSCRNC